MGKQEKPEQIEARKKFSEYHRSRYQALKAAGVCVKCGRVDALPGKIYCEACRVEHLEQTTRRYLRLGEAGICLHCAKRKAQPGQKLCWECAARNNERSGVIYRERKKAGLCPVCGQALPAGSEYKTCDACRAKKWEHKARSRERQKRAAEQGGEG